MKPTYNSADYFDHPILDNSGFREYDARWIVEPTKIGEDVALNYVGIRQLGWSLGSFLRNELGAGSDIIVGHDFRAYSENVKNALSLGLVQAGMTVVDIGLTTTPCSYFAQFQLDVPCVAMVTASHNENGWTGVKMGHGLASTFGPSEMSRFRDYALDPHKYAESASVSGTYRYHPGLRELYLQDLVAGWAPRFAGQRKLRVAVECGNGTAGLFAPELLRRLGFEVIEGNTELDWTFPHFNPNPESIPFLRSVEELVKTSRADVGLCFDGDGDRLGVVDDLGRLVFADRIGLLIARFLERHEDSKGPFVIDVKSTSLFESELTSPIVWAKTGHSYVKATVAEAGAVAGFERSGHFFFRPPFGRGYDDACVAALALLWTIAQTRGVDDTATLSSMLQALPPSNASPNRQPYVSDETKYSVVETLAAYLIDAGTLAGRPIVDVNRLNGVRLTIQDGSWLLIRASSNSPNLVVIAETFDDDGALLELIDRDVRAAIAATGVQVGHFEPLHLT